MKIFPSLSSRWLNNRRWYIAELMMLGVASFPLTAQAQWNPYGSTGFYSDETYDHSEDGNYTVTWWLNTYSSPQYEVTIVSGDLSTRTNSTGNWTSIGSVPSYTTVWGSSWYDYDKNESGKGNGTQNYWMSATVYDNYYYMYHYVDDYFDVTVAPPPDSYADQLQYEYEVRTGDFDGNGYTDILVDRLTPAYLDGSMQTVIVEGSASGTSVKVPTQGELADARMYPTNSNVELGGTDRNFDGYADLMVMGLESLSSPSYPYDCLILYAPAKGGVAQPMGHKFIDDEFVEFFGNIAQAFVDPSFYQDNTHVQERPVFALSFVCPFLFHPSSDALWRCFLAVNFVGTEPQIVGIGYHPDAPAATSAINDIIAGDYSSGDPWKRLSDVLKRILGVPSFGYQNNGSWLSTNYGFDGDEIGDEFKIIWDAFIYSVLVPGEDETVSPLAPEDWEERHVYDVGQPGVGTSICSTTGDTVFTDPPVGPGGPATVYTIPQSVCTFENVFCWVKRNVAPREDNSTETVEDGENIILDEHNPIRTHVFENERVIVNETLGGGIITENDHEFHDPLQPLDCTQFPDWGDINATHERCSYVHREVIPHGSDINITTHGEGYNESIFERKKNEFLGPIIFSGIDDSIRRRLAIQGACVDDP